MGKLIKYEWKKQRTTRLVIAIALAASILLFLGGLLFSNAAVMGAGMSVMLLGAFFGIFYVGIETILILNRDLKTKQSYMLWMVPKSVWEILGSKFISAILQMFFTFAVCIVAGLICALGMLYYYGAMGDALEAAQRMLSQFWMIKSPETGNIVLHMIWVILLIFLQWTQIIMVGFFAVILSHTLLANNAHAGWLSVAIFFVANIISAKIAIASESVIRLVPGGDSFFNLWNIIYLLIICLAMFGLSGWMSDKKLSI